MLKPSEAIKYVCEPCCDKARLKLIKNRVVTVCPDHPTMIVPANKYNQGG